MQQVRVQTNDFDTQALVDGLCEGRTDIGAVVTFTGLVRDLGDDKSLQSMTLEHYPAMTEKALQVIVREACERWDLFDALVVHRVGELKPADRIVLVVVASQHRHEAFAACEFIIDFLKTRAPFWKKERTANGEHWVEARDSDDQATERWMPGSKAT
jgi:molybdopterin synthase catalytic subunit